MALPRIATMIGGLLLSRGGRRLAGRHAGKLALATLAWNLYQQRKGGRGNQAQHQDTHPRKRWSGRRF